MTNPTAEEIKASPPSKYEVDAWIGTGDANADFEAVAAWFHRDTGLLAPGKDAPAASGYGDDYDDRRREAKLAWNGKAEALVLQAVRGLRKKLVEVADAGIEIHGAFFRARLEVEGEDRVREARLDTKRWVQIGEIFREAAG